MEFLEIKIKTPEVSIYKLSGNAATRILRYVISSKETRDICNKPEIMGAEFKQKLSTGIMKALQKMDGDFGFSKLKDRDVCVLHFLRGGLAFNLYDSISAAYGFNRLMASFITSQRYKRGRNWHIKFDQYRKLSLPERDVNFFLGDVVATGTTLENGLDILIKNCKRQKRNIRNFTLFTVGGSRAEEILGKYDAAFRKNFKYSNTRLFYIEGKFTMPSREDEFTAGIPGTDLVRRPALLAPEFELSQYDNPAYPLERCAIYDVSSRAFEYTVHLKDVIEYWEKLLSSDNSLRELYEERWPFKKSPEWRGPGPVFYRDIRTGSLRLQRWIEKNGGSKKFIKDRIENLKKLLK